MIRKEALKRLSFDKIVPIIEEKILDKGFKFVKTKQLFYRNNNEFKEIISYCLPHSPISYNEKTDELFLEFYIRFSLEHPKYDKWHFETFDRRDYFSYEIERIHTKINLDLEDFNRGDFYEPSASQKFKHLVTSSIISSQQSEENIMTIESFTDEFTAIILKYSFYENIENIIKNSEYPTKYKYLTHYLGAKNLAKSQFDIYYEKIINAITRDKKNIGYIDKLDEFVNESKTIGYEYENPFVKTIELNKTKNNSFEFSSEIKFDEILRFDISKYELDTCLVNSNGDIVILVDGKKIMKFNSSGNLLFKKEFQTQKGYRTISGYKIISKYIPEINCFILNHLLVNSENEIIEFELPDQTKNIKKGYKQYPNFLDIAFNSEKNIFLAIFQDKLLIYSEKGVIEKEISIGFGVKSKIILEKGIIIVSTQNRETLVLDFDGKILNKYAVGNGNTDFSLSNDNNLLLCYGYSTKSQLYNLNNTDKKTLWAHPTHLKNYKEIMYNDTEHNFDLSIAEFSPYDNYIIGGGYHGKYVGWTLPNFERTELIPNQEMISNLEYDAKIIEIENKTFLQNRRNSIRNIYFFKSEDFFLTELSGNFLLIWNKKFENTKFFKTNGYVKKLSNSLICEQSDDELIIYKKTTTNNGYK